MHGFLSSLGFLFKGGFMMYPLLLSAFLGLTVMLERLYTFHRKYSTSSGFIDLIMEKVRSGKTEELAAADEDCQKAGTPVSAVLAAGIEHLSNPLEEMELAMKNVGEAWMPQLEKRMDVLDTVITAAPLMGLLGTITGMMGSFQVLSEKGVNETAAITGGVAEALIATATGIFIALVCLVGHNYLNTRVKAFINDVEVAGSKLVQARLFLSRKRVQP